MQKQPQNNGKTNRIKEILSDEKQITETLQRAVRDAVSAHESAGNPIAAWRDGKVVLIETKKK